MQLPDLQQAFANAQPLTIFFAIIAGLVAFFLFRLVFRTLNVIFHLGCLVIVGLVVFLILQKVIGK